jgi:hypothetical protein
MTSFENLRILAGMLEIFHISLVLFILTGWVFSMLRPVHLLIVALTGISWLIFGSVNIYSECIITEWHWQILSKLGETDLPETYAQYLFTRITGISLIKGSALVVTRIAWFLIFLLSLVLVTWPYLKHNMSNRVVSRFGSYARSVIF